MSVLAYENVKKSYGDVQAVRGVSFDVAPGEIFGLLGPNGAGKSTLIRILMDIIRADEGSVTVFGQRVHGDLLDRIGYLPEERGLYKKQKTVEVLTYFGTLKGLAAADAKQRALLWLRRLGLPETALWNVERLSKGMSQKVQIAAALIHDPELAVLDEPLSGLDPVNVEIIQNLIRERKQQGKTTILSTHQMDMVEALCDRVALIDKGELMIYGAVNDVRRQYSNNELRVAVEGPLPALSGVDVSAEPRGDAYRLKLQPGSSSNGVLAALLASGAQIKLFEEVLTPMHDVFVAVVEGRRQ